MERYNVPLPKLIEDFGLEPIFMPQDFANRKIVSSDINRPGLQFYGFFEFFDEKRLQILGRVEMTYLAKMDDRENAINGLFSKEIPAVIITRGLEIVPEIIAAAKKYNVPLFRTDESTSRFMAALIAYLNVILAPRITRHGVLVEVYGEGVLLLGESGVGKSEAAIELVKRGHRLVADDAVEIKRVSAKTLVGSSPENIRHFIEIRGIGIVDVKKIFGMGAVKDTESIELVIQMELWNEKKAYERLGIENEFIEILGIQVPSITVPVRPGRNLAIIMEVAAMNHRQKRMGYNAARELLIRINKMAGAENEQPWGV